MARTIFREKFRSMRLAMLAATVFAAALAIGAYLLVQILANGYIKNNYILEENKLVREKEYAEELQKYVNDNSLSSEDVAILAEWAQSNRYLYVMIHKDDELLFEEDDDKKAVPPILKVLLYVCSVLAAAVLLAVAAWECADEILALTAEDQIMTVTVEENATIHPLEIKKSASPDKREVKKYTVLDKAELSRGNGGIVCMCEEPMPIDDKNCFIPSNLI